MTDLDPRLDHKSLWLDRKWIRRRESLNGGAQNGSVGKIWMKKHILRVIVSDKSEWKYNRAISHKNICEFFFL